MTDEQHYFQVEVNKNPSIKHNWKRYGMKFRTEEEARKIAELLSNAISCPSRVIEWHRKQLGVYIPEKYIIKDAEEPCKHENLLFDRSVCPEPCGSMHYYCEACSELVDECALQM